MYMFLATFLAFVCLFLIIGTLIWKKLIEMRLVDAEKDLLKQLSDDSYQPGWHKIVIAPRSPLVNDTVGQPPPYDYYSEETNK
jgi:hypothetical protein